IKGDSASPAVVAGHGSIRRHVSVVIDEIVIGSEIVAIEGSDSGTSCITDRFANESEMVRAAAEESVGGVGLAVKIQATEFEVSGVRREGAAAEVEHSGGVGGAGPEEIDGTVAVRFVY